MIRIVKAAYVSLVYAFLYVPILVLVVFAFNDSRVATNWQGFSLRWFAKLFGNETLLGAAVNSVLVGVLAATLATAIGTLAAVAIYRYRFLGRKVLSTAVYILTIQPDIVMGISLLVLFMAVRMPLGFTTLLLAHVTFCIPFVTITVLGRLKGFDTHIVEAAQDLGASEYEIFLRIILPMILPAVAAGWLLSFTLSLDDVMVSFFVTGPSFEILPLKIYAMVKLGVKPEVNALSAILLVLTFCIVFAAQLMMKERREK
jgi:spermidine/putrescine transport system permease protein